MVKILLVPAHHRTTPGKRSPDGKLLEYAYSREIIERITEKLVELGYDVENPIPETEHELSLGKQCELINKIYDECGGDCICISPHINAGGDGSQWLNAKGWSCFIYRYAGNKTKKLASCITEAAKKEGLKIRYEYPDVPYWVSGLYICKYTKSPCVLTENLFQDNHEDVDFLLSEEGKQAITNLHIQGILNYIKDEQNLQ